MFQQVAIACIDHRLFDLSQEGCAGDVVGGDGVEMVLRLLLFHGGYGRIRTAKSLNK